MDFEPQLNHNDTWQTRTQFFSLSSHLCMKEGSLFGLFCTYEIHRTGMLQVFLVSLESSQGGGVHPLGYIALWCRSSWILDDSSLKIKLNRSWKFQRNWNVPLVLLERSWWVGFNGIYSVRFGFRLWEILILKWFLCWKFK